ncbi:MAG: glycosyltransferase family 2 protein [Candidatus Kryptoniota bacterium]
MNRASGNEVSVLIINFNSSPHTIDCVRSLIQNSRSSLNYNIIVVDNNSEASEFEALLVLKVYKNVMLLRSRVNLGFSGGHTFGLQFANAKYYFFLNNDSIILNDCLGILYDFCESVPKAALCTPQLYTESMERHSSFLYPPTLVPTLFGYSFARLVNKNRYPDLNKRYEVPLPVDMISGSAMFVRAEAFNEIGGFDTNYFLYGEEEDLAIRLRNAGYMVYLVPFAHVQHLGQKSTSKSVEMKKEFYISYFYFYRKHYGFLKTMVFRGLVFLKLLKKGLKNRTSFNLAKFVLFNAKPWNSIRHKQKIR